MYRTYSQWLILGCLIQPILVNGAELNLVTEQSPPYNYLENQQVTGLATEKITLALKQIHQPFHLQLLPWARALQQAQSQPDTCIFSTTRTAARESLFKWVGPIAYNLWVLYGRESLRGKIKALEDAKPYIIGTYNADVRDDFLKKLGFRVDTAAQDEMNLAKLKAGRIDLWASSPFEVKSIVNSPKEMTSIVPILTFNRVDLYLACNRQVPDALISKLQKTLDAQAAAGLHQAIDLRYQFNSKHN